MDFDSRGFIYTSITVSVLLTLFASFFFLKNSKYRTVVGSSPILASLLFLVINVLTIYEIYADTIQVLYSLYTVLIYLPIIYVSHRIIKNEDDLYIKTLVNLGFFWPLLHFSTSIAVAKFYQSNSNDFYVARLIYVVTGWILVLTTWITLVIVSPKLSKKSRGSMIAFAMFFTYPNVADRIYTQLMTLVDLLEFSIVTYFFEIVTVIGVIVIITLYSPYWIEDSINPTKNDIESRRSNGSVVVELEESK